MSFAKVWNSEEGSLGSVGLPFWLQKRSSDSEVGGQKIFNDGNTLWQSWTCL